MAVANCPETAPGILLLQPPGPAQPGWEVPNLYLIGERELTLVDAGLPGPQAAALVLEAAAGRPLRQIILTHGHLDHAGAVPALQEKTGCAVVCHELEKDSTARRTPGAAIGRLVREGDALAAEGRTLRVVHTPGHTPGHLALWIEAEGILFSGDLVTGAGSTFIGPPEGDMADYLASLAKVAALPLRQLLPGHGPVPPDAGQRVRELIFHRQLREVQIGKVLEQGPQTIARMVEIMYRGLIHPNLHFVAGQTLLAHLDKLQKAGSVAYEPPGAPPPARTYRLTAPTPLPF